jgi:hypothetical protein
MNPESEEANMRRTAYQTHLSKQDREGEESDIEPETKRMRLEDRSCRRESTQANTTPQQEVADQADRKDLHV